MNFWQKLPKPFFILAPMADVTDPAFRALVAKYGKLDRTDSWRGGPDVMYTEFVSADGLFYTNEKVGERPRNAAEMRVKPSAGEAVTLSSRRLPREHTFPPNPLMRDLQFTEAERPIVMQVFTSKPEMIAYAAKLAEELGFDGFDINMGCPAGPVEKQGAGACLIQDPNLAQELIRTAKAATTLPVSVKTRIGFNKENLDEWLLALLKAEPVAITLHLRTKKEMSSVPAHWELMKKAVEIRNKINPNVLIIGNGDVKDLEEAKQKVKETGCDGVMLGRAIFGNPWLFSQSENNPERSRGIEEKLKALVELAHAFEKLSPPKNFAILKKHIKAFVTGFDGAAEMRAKLMEANTAAELEAVIKNPPQPLPVEANL